MSTGAREPVTATKRRDWTLVAGVGKFTATGVRVPFDGSKAVMEADPRG
jgi:hypothetical protein